MADSSVSMPEPRRFWGWRRILATCSGSVAALAGVAIVSAQLSQTPILALPLQYQIRTQVNTGSGCSSQRIVTGLYGVPQPVSVTGSLVPDISVLVVPTPSLPGIGLPTTLSMTVNRLSTRALPIRVEALISPAGSLDPSRISVGYDTCDSNAPTQFHTTITSQPTKLTLNADDSGAAAALSILGGTYTLSGNNETNPTHVTAHFSPVPSSMTAVVDILGNSKYTAHVTTAAPSTLGFDYVQQDSSSSTIAHIGLADLPKTADVTFSPTAVSYATSAVIHDTTVDVTTAAPKSWTQRVIAHVVDLPTSASLTRDGAKHATFFTSSKIGDATVRFASYDPNASGLPAPPIDANQYVRATTRPDFLVADVHVLGFSNAVASWDNPISVDFTHTAGPFDFFVDTGSLVASGSVLNLPDHVQLSYAPTTQAVTYTGSAVIGTLTADVYKTDGPLAGRADQGHLVAHGIPTGLGTVLNSDARTFAVTLTGGTLTSIELQLTNGLDQRLPAGTDGLLFNDPADPSTTPPPGTPYVIFVRATQVASATVGWGDPLSGSLTHTAAPFAVSVQTHDMAISGTFANLPAIVNFSLHVPSTLLVRQVGAPPPPPTSLTYSASGPMDQLALDIVRTTPFVKTANHIHVNAQGIPQAVELTIDPGQTQLTGDIANPGITLLEVQLTDTAGLCAPGDCLAPGPEGVRLLDVGTVLDPTTAHYNAFVRLHGLKSPPAQPTTSGGTPPAPPLLFNWGDSNQSDPSKDVPLQVNLTHTPGPLTVSVVTQDLVGLAVNTRHVDGTIQDLPGTVNLSYLSSTQALTYNGSAAIGLIDAIVTNSSEFIASKAKELDLHLENVPTNVTLGVDTSQLDSEAFSVNAANGAIGKLELFLTDGGHDDRIEFGSGDGIFIKDSAPVYNIFVRATGLQHVDYSQTKVVDGDTYVKTDVHSTLLGGKDLELLLENKAAPNTKAGDLEYTKITYQTPPPKNHVTVQRVFYSEDDYNKSKDAYTEITYDGTAVDGTPMNGGALDFQTNKGKFRTLLHATVDSVPSHTYVCVAPGTTGCAPSHAEGLFSEPASYAIEVSSPIHVTMRDCTVSILGVVEVPSTNVCDPNYPIQSAGLVRADLTVDSHFRVLKQIQQGDCTPDCMWINLDTASTPVSGSIDSGHFGDDGGWNSDVFVNLPNGFEADNRQARISCAAGCSGTGTAGRVACPPGMELISRHWFGDIHLAPEFCTGPTPQSVTPNAMAAGHTAIVDLYGTDFSPGWAIVVGSQGPGGQFTADPDITVIGTQWVDYWHIRLQLSIGSAALPGPRDILVGGPTGNNGVCAGCLQVTPG